MRDMWHDYAQAFKNIDAAMQERAGFIMEIEFQRNACKHIIGEIEFDLLKN